jgi:hypothetical protein
LRALDPDPQAQINPNPLWIGSSAFSDVGCMILYLVCTLGGVEQAGGEPDGERHRVLDPDRQTPNESKSHWDQKLCL